METYKVLNDEITRLREEKAALLAARKMSVDQNPELTDKLERVRKPLQDKIDELEKRLTTVEKRIDQIVRQFFLPK